jgi:glycosyltransferase involved in cell wall biosynthesis
LRPRRGCRVPAGAGRARRIRRKGPPAAARSDEPGEILVRGLPLPGYKGLQFGLPSGKVLRRAWTRRRPNAVYVATEGPLGWSAIRTARRLGIPVLSGFHTNFHSYSRFYFAAWLQPVVFRYLRAFHNRTNGTLVPTADLRDRLQALGFDNVSVLGRGVDVRLFGPHRRCAELRRAWGASDRDTVVLYVGRIAAEKNLGLAIDAYRAIQRTDRSAKFVMVGDGPLLAAIRQRHSDFIFCGLRTGEDLARHYASGDLFLFPSETETFGNVTLEAMASGLAVVAYDYAAAKMHIRNGKTGFLVPYGDARAFVEAVLTFARSPSAFGQLRNQAREYAVGVGWPAVVARFEDLVTDIRGHNRDAQSPPSERMLGGVAAIGRT